MNGFQALLTFLEILVIANSDLLDKYTRGPGNVYHGRYTRDVHEPEFLIPRRVHEDGIFDTYSLPNFYDRRELNERRKRSTEAGQGEGAEEGQSKTDKLHLVLPFNGIEHHVELSPYHEFISPDMVIETRGAGIRTNLNEAVRFKRAPDLQCHYRGFVRGHHASKAALSLCDGVVGYVHTNSGRYFIEPVSESEPEQDGQHVHIAYKRNAPQNPGESPKRHCGTDDNWEAAWAEQLARREKQLMEEGNTDVGKRDTPVVSGTHSIHRYIEIGVVADRRFLDFHNNTNYEQYLLTIVNMASDYYHDSSVGNQLDVVIVRMIYLEKEKEEIDLLISPAAEETLVTFAKWADRINPKEADHPNHFDIAVLVTRYDICSKKSGCDLTGLAFLGAACDRTKAACINEDSGLLIGAVMAHEIGHVMGSSHDQANEGEPGCPSKDKDGSNFIMSPILTLFTIRWSSCSRKYITTLLESGLGECLNDNPKKPSERFNLPNMLPGAMYDANYQCQLAFPGSKICRMSQEEFCRQLWCETNRTAPGSCSGKMGGVAEGTKCGENMWCIHQKCVEMGARPAAVHGGWGSWGPSSSCSRSCGGGIKVAERECDKPVPSNGGRYCVGERKKATICNSQPCDSKQPPFRAVQCSLYNNVKVTTDGLHTWKPYHAPDLDSCTLYCINEKNTFVRLSPSVNDSTPCKAGTNNMCISGVCRIVGCDWVLDSDAIEDKCGVCKGDGTQCKKVEGFFNDTDSMSPFAKVVTLPKGARSIHVAEGAPHTNMLAVRLEKNESFYCLNAGRTEMRSGDYECLDFLIIYLHPEPDKEEIQIKGPISEEIRIEYVLFNRKTSVGVRYSYYVKSTNSTYVPKYIWDFTEWSDCSALCGGGTMVSEPSCIEENAGKVTSNFCMNLPRPEAKSRTCNTDPCPAKWRVSQWSKCSACDGKKGLMHRKVQCVRPAARPGEDDVQANLDACKGRVPKQKQDCVGKRPCRKSCPKKARDAAEKLAVEKEKTQPTSVEDQAKMIDRFVDLSLARYLEKARGIVREANEESKRASDGGDFRQLLREWSMAEKEKKKKKRSNCVPLNLTTPKPGSIVVDTVPIDSVVLYEAPMMDENLQANLSDRAYREGGDIVGVGVDISRQKVYRGAEAVKIIDELSHPNATAAPSPVKENYTYDRLASIVDAVDR